MSVLNNNIGHELECNLKALAIVNSPSKSKKPKYLGDDEDHSSRAPRSAMSPSPHQDEQRNAEQKQEALLDMADAYRNILRSVGEDPTREGLQQTPMRASKAMLYFTKGYDEKISGRYYYITLYNTNYPTLADDTARPPARPPARPLC